MSTSDTIARGVYDIHGIGLEVIASDPAVIEALELRFRGFPCEPGDHATVRLEFTVDDGHEPEPQIEAERPVYDTPHGSLSYFPAGDALCGTLGGVHLRCNASRGAAVLRSAEFTGHDLYLATHPLATISLMELLERRGRFALHAACVATSSGRGVLLAGASGAGKSTLALALAHAGMCFLSDDIVFLAPEHDSGGVSVLGFADTVGVTDYAAARIPALQPLRDVPPADGFTKRLHRIEDLFGAPALPACTPHALVFPKVSPDEPSRISPLDSGEAMLQLVPDVLLTDPAATQAHLRAIAALLKQVSCFTLRSGTDLERAVELVRALV
jgi:hypothetical protein